jgi:hypothetical protein
VENGFHWHGICISVIAMNEAKILCLVNIIRTLGLEARRLTERGMSMYRFIGVCSMMLTFVVSSSSQTPTGITPSTRWLLDSQVGTDPGYSLPSLAAGVSIERPITEHIELQGGVSFSPTKTLSTNDGNHFDMYGEGLFWVTQRFAAAASLSRGYLWTSHYDLQGWSPSIGLAIREESLGAPGRLYLSYLIPTGCQWGPSCPIQSSRETGAKIYWEHRMSSHWRFGFEFGIYHVLNQGNPLDPAAGRTGQLTGDAHIVSRFEFPRGGLEELY